MKRTKAQSAHAAFWFLVVALILVGPGLCPAETVTDDFEDGDLAGWEFREKDDVRLIEEDGNMAVRLDGVARVQHGGEKYEQFVCEVDVKKLESPGGYAGLAFDRYLVFFSGRRLWLRYPGNPMVAWVRKKFDVMEYRRLKIVSTGRIIRVYVDGKMQVETLHDKHVAGPVALYVHHRATACFDNFRVSTDVSLDDQVIVMPRDEDGALVFDAGQDNRVNWSVVNTSGEALRLGVKLGVRRYGGEVLAPADSREVTVAAGETRTVRFPLDVPSGYHEMRMTLSRDGRPVRTTSYPVLVREDPPSGEYTRPEFVFGMFLRYTMFRPYHTKTSMHCIGYLLSNRGFNTVIGTGLYNREHLGIFREYGMSVLVRGPGLLEEPNAIGALVYGTSGRYADRMKELDKPLTGTLKGQLAGTGEKGDPLEYWKKYNPKVRAFYFMPIRDGRGLLHGVGDDEVTSPLERLKLLQSAAKTPTWVHVQAHGRVGDGEGANNPSPAEMRAMTHLALATGARGVLYYWYQTLDADLPALVDWVSLQPVDDKFEATARMAALVSRHADLLASLRPGEGNVQTTNPQVAVESLKNADGRFLYVVNMNTRKKNACRLEPLKVDVRDLYSGDVLPAEDGGVSLRLSPGQGRLLAVGEKRPQ